MTKALRLSILRDQAERDALAADNARLRAALKEIKVFGANNSGCGITCALMADKALKPARKGG